MISKQPAQAAKLGWAACYQSINPTVPWKSTESVNIVFLVQILQIASCGVDPGGVVATEYQITTPTSG